MSVCAIAVLLALGPVLLGPLQSDRDRSLSQGLEELAGCFEEVADCPGEARMVVDVGRFLGRGSGHFLVREGSLWAFGEGLQLARNLPVGFHLFEHGGEGAVEVKELMLLASHTLIIEGRMAQSWKVLEAHIENLRATSTTLSANPSASLSEL